MIFAVLGASGQTGIRVVGYALDSGHRVRALVRNPIRSPALLDISGGAAFEIITGDVTDPAATAEVIRGADAVISALGPRDLQTGLEVHSSAALHLSRQMPKEGISRYVSVSGASLSVPTDRFSIRGKFFSTAAFVFTKKDKHLSLLLADKRREYEILKESSLDWTMVRPPWIVPGEYIRDANITPFTLQGSKVRVGELAKALVDLAMTEKFKRQAVFINSK